MSLHVLKADVSSLPYAKCEVGCDKPSALQCLLGEKEHDADGGDFILQFFWSTCFFLSYVPVTLHTSFSQVASWTHPPPSPPHPPPRKELCFVLAMTWYRDVTPFLEGLCKSWCWSMECSSHWACCRCYNKVNPIQDKRSSNKPWGPTCRLRPIESLCPSTVNGTNHFYGSTIGVKCNYNFSSESETQTG